MIAKMEKLLLYGLQEEVDNVISQLLRLGCVEISSPENLPDYEQLKELMQHKPADLYQLEQQQSRLWSAIQAISPYEPKKSMFAHRTRVGFDCLTDQTLITQAEEICTQVESALQGVSELKSRVSREEFILTSLQPWLELDLPLELEETGKANVEYLVFPASANLSQLQADLSADGLGAVLSQQHADNDQQYGVLVFYKGDKAPVWELIRAQGGVPYRFDNLQGTPAENAALCRMRIEQCNSEIEKANEAIQQLATQADTVKLAYDVVKTKLDCLKSRSKLLNTGSTFMLTAWVPSDNKPTVESYLASSGCFYEFSQPDKEEDFPVLLKNKKLVEPFEVITELYSLPSPHGIDPGGAMAFFYFVFFGIMLSDAGYGLILLLGGLFALKKLDLAPFAKKFVKMITLGGVSTIFWGALYGSWFGNAIPQIAQIFFGKKIEIPYLLDPMNDPVTILILSFVMGAIHIFVAMGFNAYLMIKRGHVWDAIFDVGFWYLVLIGLPMLLFPGVWATIGKYMAIVGAVGLVLTQGRSKPNPISRLISGIISLYGVTGYLSDVLSYSRILALGLATGVIGNVVNIMGTMPGPGPLGAIVLIAVFLFGHALNMAINVLGSYVHASRLQYVEYFGKFYESGGRPFNPLKANTKYVYLTDRED